MTKEEHDKGMDEEMEKNKIPNNVIDIDCMEPHLTGELICVRCGYRYIGTWNEKIWLKDLYCPNCQTQGFNIATRTNLGGW